MTKKRTLSSRRSHFKKSCTQVSDPVHILPCELVFVVLGMAVYRSTKDLLSSVLVCQRWRDILYSAPFWRETDVPLPYITMALNDCERMLKSPVGRHCQRIAITLHEDDGPCKPKMLRRLSGLRDLTLVGIDEEHGIGQSILRACTGLRSLDYAFPSDRTTSDLIQGLPLLESLWCEGLFRPKSSLPSLTSLNTYLRPTDEFYIKEMFMDRMPNLTEFILYCNFRTRLPFIFYPIARSLQWLDLHNVTLEVDPGCTFTALTSMFLANVQVSTIAGASLDGRRPMFPLVSFYSSVNATAPWGLETRPGRATFCKAFPKLKAACMCPEDQVHSDTLANAAHGEQEPNSKNRWRRYSVTVDQDGVTTVKNK